MSDISVNIRGRDDGLGQHLDSLRQKANALGVEVSNLNRITSMSPTEQKIAVNRVGENTLREQQSSIRRDYSEIRRSQFQDYNEAKASYESGGMSKKDFDAYEKRFQSEQQITNKDEQKELVDTEREISRLLRLISKEMIDKRKLDVERSQRDKEEFNEGGATGIIGKLLSEQRELRRRRSDSTSDEEISLINEELEENRRKIRDYYQTDGKSSGGGGGVNLNQINSATSAVGTGDLVGSAMATPQLMRGVGMSGGTVAAAGGIVGALYGLYQFLNLDQKLIEDTAPLASMRGFGGRAGLANQNYRDPNFLDGDGNLGNLGLERGDMARSMYQKAITSGVTGESLRRRTLDDTAFQKGFGADVGIFSQFERFGGGESSQIGLDILNVLTSINESSLKSNDLVTLTEKLKSGESIMSIQRQKRDMVDADSSLKVLAAFESIGLSGKGEKGADFLSNTIQGLGEGGSDNVMMLKLEAAKRSRPDLANDPAALRRLVKFNSDSPEYLNEAFKMFGQISGGDKMAEDDLLYSFFNPQSEMDMDIYKKAMTSGDFSSILKGKNISSMKQRKSGLDEMSMYQDAASGTGTFTQSMMDFKNMISEFSTKFSSILGLDGSSVNVSVVKDSTKPKNNTIPRNSTTGKN